VYGSNKILWSSEAIGVPSGFMYMCKNGLIVPRADGKVVCVDPKNGTERWSFSLAVASIYASLCSGDPHSPISRILERGHSLYFTSLDGYLYKLSSKTGKVQKRIALGAPSLSTPVWTSEGIVCADYDAVIHCLKHF
ncbi:MAG: PQQ-binding-like beta-propeller repeat protein, partial [Planctomycetes bacterium]|nr:PQQ-binding-like beta-propeller repeat protein [Planctomycetota bacterium]